MDVVRGSLNDARTMNQFAYANGNPISFIDPFGTSAQKDFSAWDEMLDNINKEFAIANQLIGIGGLLCSLCGFAGAEFFAVAMQILCFCEMVTDATLAIMSQCMGDYSAANKMLKSAAFAGAAGLIGSIFNSAGPAFISAGRASALADGTLVLDGARVIDLATIGKAEVIAVAGVFMAAFGGGGSGSAGVSSEGTSKVTNTAKSVLKDAQLPTKGKIRYVPPEKWTPSQPLPKIDGGYIDKFDNIWTKGPSRTEGEPFEWDIQLSKAGKNQLGWASRDGSHLNVSLDGEITHK